MAGSFALASSSPAMRARRAKEAPQPLPSRPDVSVLSEKIPLFYIGRNAQGLWVAREAQGQCGGLFLLRSSAARFAQRMSAPHGCATMGVEGLLALDIANQGSLSAAIVAALIAALEQIAVTARLIKRPEESR